MFLPVHAFFTREFVAKKLCIFETDNPKLIPLDKHDVSYRCNPTMAAIVYSRYSNRICKFYS